MKTYKGRKKYSKEKAEEQLELLYQQYSINKECIQYWFYFPETKTDKLIQSLCNKTRKEMINDNLKSNEYIKSKIKYMEQFSPCYIPKGSFGIFDIGYAKRINKER